MDGAEAFMLLLCGVQLVLQSSVLIVLDLDYVNVTLDNTKIFGSVLSGEGGSVGGGRQCFRSAHDLLTCHLSLLRTRPPSLLV